METLKTFWFFDEVYKQNILFCIGSRNETVSYLKKNHGLNIEFTGKEGAKTFDVSDYGIIIWMPKFSNKPNDFGYLMHEITHAGLFVMDKVGIQVDWKSCEPLTYYVESITRKFLELYNKKKKK